MSYRRKHDKQVAPILGVEFKDIGFTVTCNVCNETFDPYKVKHTHCEYCDYATCDGKDCNLKKKINEKKQHLEVLRRQIHETKHEIEQLQKHLKKAPAVAVGGHPPAVPDSPQVAVGGSPKKDPCKHCGGDDHQTSRFKGCKCHKDKGGCKCDVQQPSPPSAVGGAGETKRKYAKRGSGKHKCLKCERTYANKTSLQRHMRNKHGSQKKGRKKKAKEKDEENEKWREELKKLTDVMKQGKMEGVDPDLAAIIRAKGRARARAPTATGGGAHEEGKVDYKKMNEEMFGDVGDDDQSGDFEDVKK